LWSNGEKGRLIDVVDVVGVKKVLAMVFDFGSIDFRDLKITIVVEEAFLTNFSLLIRFFFFLSLLRVYYFLIILFLVKE
jgi:hypothetical protein